MKSTSQTVFLLAGMYAFMFPASVCGSSATDYVAVFSPHDPHRSRVDIPVSLDLSEAWGVAFDFQCDDLTAFTGLSVHLKSGGGWYRCGRFEPERLGRRRRVELQVVGCGREGRVRSLKDISALRLSLWRGLTNSVRYSVSSIAPCGRKAESVVVVRGDWLAKHGGESAKASAMRHFLNAGKVLRAAGFIVAEVSDEAIDDETLRSVPAVVLPYNPQLPDGASAALDRYAGCGGLVIRGTKGVVGKLLEERPELTTGLQERKQELDRRKRVEKEWVASRSGKFGERRAFWCHSAYGMQDCDWSTSVAKMRALGFNILFANVCWAGTAYYASEVLPVAAEVADRGDALEECLSACRRHGVECHAWKVCWNLGTRATDEFRKRLSDEGRMQMNFAGRENPIWMCPNHKANHELEVASIVEVAKKGVAGVHLDYIRYPGTDYCFCPTCRKAFERKIGRAVGRWPQDIGDDKALAEAWTNFRAEAIGAVVRDIAKHVRAEAPGVRISAAVTGDPSRAVVERGQDWVGWCRNGWLDFACPMNYTESPCDFAGRIAQQRELVGAKRLMPGIGLTCWGDSARDAFTLSCHIESARTAGLGGFVVFSLAPRAIESMTPLRMAVLAD